MEAVFGCRDPLFGGGSKTGVFGPFWGFLAKTPKTDEQGMGLGPARRKRQFSPSRPKKTPTPIRSIYTYIYMIINHKQTVYLVNKKQDYNKN